MTPDGQIKMLPSRWRPCAIAFAWVLVAFSFGFLLKPWLGDELPLMLFVAAALAASVHGGAMAGVIALVLGLFLGDYFLVSSVGVSALASATHWLCIIGYVFTVSIGIVLIESLHRSEMQARRADEALQRYEAELKEAKTGLSQYADKLETLVREHTSEMEESLKSLEDMLYHIAHNFPAPLRSVNGFATLLRENYGPKLDETGREYTVRVQKASLWMDTIIRDLLAFGRLSHIKIVPTPTDLKSLLDGVLQDLTSQIKSNGAVVEVSGPLPEVWASESVLNQVLFNLLDNALKFVPPGTKPRVSIWAEERDSKVRLLIQDNGIGIDPKYHERIFRPFETLQPGVNDRTGIGLALVKRGMQRMGGEVGLESELGKGSCFWLELPLKYSKVEENYELRRKN